MRALGLSYIGTSTGDYGYLEAPPASFWGSSFSLSDATLGLRSSCRMGRMAVDLRYEAAFNEGEDAEEVVFYPRFSMIDAVEDSLLIIGFKQERYFTHPISPRGSSFRYERATYNLSADPYGNAAAIRRLIESSAAGGTSVNDEEIYLLSVRTLKVVALI